MKSTQTLDGDQDDEELDKNMAVANDGRQDGRRILDESRRLKKILLVMHMKMARAIGATT